MVFQNKVYQEADEAGSGKGIVLKSIWESDVEVFYSDQKKNSKLELLFVMFELNIPYSNWKKRKQMVIIRICLCGCLSVIFSIYNVALAIFSRSPSAFRALRGLGILNLPCDATIKGYMNQNASKPGINEQAIFESSERYKKHVHGKLQKGEQRPLKEGILNMG